MFITNINGLGRSDPEGKFFMSAQLQSPLSQRPAAHARDLQAKLYRDIGISAVAAALRFTTQPEPPVRQAADSHGARSFNRTTLAA